ncbi:AraC family transcriptional regulator [Gordonia sp. PKS22-38]|uniref:AraC family transcriptional regulator n=1 Tax=Gordonia prachuapensis TaxID=3115651 RepID=A0ABU7MXM9_9ACTN|nr:AraC family transcriptional regulator [Gordonia sp. PKS22-38]
MGGEWRGQYRLGIRRVVLAGSFGAAKLHRHPIVQVTVAYSGDLLATNGFDERRCRAVVIPGGATHTISPVGDDVRVLSLHMPAWTAEAKAVGGLVPPGGGPSDWVAAAAVLEDLHLDEAMDIDVAADKVMDVLLATTHSEVENSKVAAAVELIGSRVPGKLRMHDLTRVAAASQSSLSRLFTRETGMSFAATVRWVRMLYAAQVAESGGTITDAAHAAGFTDSAHAHRVCLEMTGVTPKVIWQAARNGDVHR